MAKDYWYWATKKNNCVNCGKDLFLTRKVKYCSGKCKKLWKAKQ